jgi:hypothetical protein
MTIDDRWRCLRLFGLGLVLIGLAAGSVVSLASAQEAGGADEAMAEMMAAWQAYAAVGPAHESLHRRAGSWQVEVKFWYAPDAPPEVSNASSTIEPILGGRYMLERFQSVMPDGSAFEGLGLMGYDNLEDRFVAAWVDTMSSGILTAESTSFAGDYSRIEYRGEVPDPVAGTFKVQRTKEQWRDASTRVFEAWETGPDGSEHKVMEMTYSRAK